MVWRVRVICHTRYFELPVVSINRTAKAEYSSAECFGFLVLKLLIGDDTLIP